MFLCLLWVESGHLTGRIVSPATVAAVAIGRFISPAGTSRRGSVLGFILAPLAGTYVYGLSLCVGALIYQWPMPPRDAVALVVAAPLFIVIFGTMLSYPGILLIGVPSWMFLRRAKAEGLVPYAVAGLVGGSFLPPVQRGWSFLGEPPVLHNQVAGMLVMASFWFIARNRRTPEPTLA